MINYILLFAIIFASCDAPVMEQQGSGFFTPQPEESFVNASDEFTDIYVAWVQAHNDKDIEAILSYQTEDIRLDLADGSVIVGSEAHSTALENYFATNPVWEIYWAMPYKGLLNDETWIIAGQSVTNENEGEETTVLIMADAQFTDGKISRLIAYEKDIPPSE